MKRINLISFSFAVALLLGFVSCKNTSKGEQTRDEQVAEFRAELTSADTTAMLNICDAAMEQLKQKNIDQVLASLFEYNDSTKELLPLSDKLRNRYQRIFQRFPVLEYELQYYSFMLEGCNDVKYQVTFATAEQMGSDQPATTMYMFNPVRVNGEWKLCVKNADDEFDTNYQ